MFSLHVLWKKLFFAGEVYFWHFKSRIKEIRLLTLPSHISKLINETQKQFQKMRLIYTDRKELNFK